MIKGWINVAEGLPTGEKPVIVRDVFNGETVSSVLYSCAKFKAMVEKYQFLGFNISGWEWLDESPADADGEAVTFLDTIREYERESGNSICYDERTSAELYEIYKPTISNLPQCR